MEFREDEKPIVWAEAHNLTNITGNVKNPFITFFFDILFSINIQKKRQQNTAR